jgi:hypothetical protein
MVLKKPNKVFLNNLNDVQMFIGILFRLNL